MHRTPWHFIGLLAALAATPASAQPGHEGHDHEAHGHSHVPYTTDSGSFSIFRQGVELGTESFTYVVRGDSLVVSSSVLLFPKREGVVDTLEKSMMLVVGDVDHDLRSYQSRLYDKQDEVLQGLVMQDTSFTVFTQINKLGSGSSIVRPPGHMFVMDPQVFVLYDVVCRNLVGKTFTSRPVRFFSMGGGDSLIEATARDLGRETLRRGDVTLETRKLEITFGAVEFFVWMSEKGQMLLLDQPAYGLRVERDPETVRPVARRGTKGG